MQGIKLTTEVPAGFGRSLADYIRTRAEVNFIRAERVAVQIEPDFSKKEGAIEHVRAFIICVNVRSLQRFVDEIMTDVQTNRELFPYGASVRWYGDNETNDKKAGAALATEKTAPAGFDAGPEPRPESTVRKKKDVYFDAPASMPAAVPPNAPASFVPKEGVRFAPSDLAVGVNPSAFAPGDPASADLSKQLNRMLGTSQTRTQALRGRLE